MPGVTANANPPTQGSKYRIKVGQTIGALVWSNIATTVKGFWTIIYDDGSPDYWPMVETASGSSRATVLVPTSQVAKKNGWVVDGYVGVNTPTVPQRGQVYVQAIIVDPNLSVTSSVIACGYAYAGHLVNIGTFVEPGPAGGPGQLREITSADPAAAAELADQVVPVGAIWLLRLFTVQLVQGITQTPLPALEFEDGSGIQVGVIPAMPTALGASTTAQLTWGIGLTQISFLAVVADEIYTAPLPVVYLSQVVGPDRFATLTDGIGANTNYGAATYSVEEWVVPN